MLKTNLISFFVIGTHVKDSKIKIVHLNKTSRGWYQKCLNDNGFYAEYVSNENIPQLLDWFRFDFSSYRIFDSEEEAMSYLNEKMQMHTPSKA